MFNIKMFEDILQNQVNEGHLSMLTMDGYMRCLQKMEKHCKHKSKVTAVDLEQVLESICSDNNQIGKYISTVKKYERDVLNSPQILLYGEPLMRLRRKQSGHGNGKALANTEQTYKHKINAIKDVNMKVALRLQEKSGLRVSEIASLHKADITFGEKDIALKVRNGKGGKERIVSVIEDAYLYQNLQDIVEEKGEEEKLFNTASAIKKKAGDLGMETHDLRRINSRQRFRKERDSGASRREARTAVSRELGHSAVKITNLYLGDEWTDNALKDEEN